MASSLPTVLLSRFSDVHDDLTILDMAVCVRCLRTPAMTFPQSPVVP